MGGNGTAYISMLLYPKPPYPKPYPKTVCTHLCNFVWELRLYGTGTFSDLRFLPPHGLLPPATKLGQSYVFTNVCDSVHRGVSALLHAGIHPRDQRQAHPPGPKAGTHYPGTRGRHTPPRTRDRHPQTSTPLGPEAGTPWEHTPQRSACWEIRAISGRYASYWNAILLKLLKYSWNGSKNYNFTDELSLCCWSQLCTF